MRYVKIPLFAAALVAALPLTMLAGCRPEVTVEDAVEEVEPLNPPDVPTEMESTAGLEILQLTDFVPGPAAQGEIDGYVRVMIPPAGAPQGTHIEARVEGLSPGPHAWHIHAGPCGETAPVLVAFTPTEQMQGIDEPLVAGEDGVAEETAFVPEATLALERIRTEDLSVHVHTGGGVEHGPTVACAPL